MQGTMFHCGAEAIDRNVLAAMPVPAPRGPRHVTRPFIQDVEDVSHLVSRYGLEIESEAWGVTKDKDNMPARFFGAMQLRGDRNDYGLMVGLRGSYDQSLPRGMAVGASVFVCDNLCFSGSIVMHTRQTTNIDSRIYGMWSNAVAQIPEEAQRQDARFDNYKLAHMQPRHGDAAIVELVRRKVVMPSQVAKVVNEWDEPSHEEHAEDGFTLWRLHNAVTEGIKPSNADRAALPTIMDRTITMTNWFDEIAPQLAA